MVRAERRGEAKQAAVEQPPGARLVRVHASTQSHHIPVVAMFPGQRHMRIVRSAGTTLAACVPACAELAYSVLALGSRSCQRRAHDRARLAVPAPAGEDVGDVSSRSPSSAERLAIKFLLCAVELPTRIYSSVRIENPELIQSSYTTVRADINGALLLSLLLSSAREVNSSCSAVSF